LTGNFKGEDGTFTSFVRGVYIKAQEPLEAGKVYYMGTLNYHISKKSFLETGDEEYDMEQAFYVVPDNLTLPDELSDAKSWLKKSLGYDGPVHKMPLKMEFNEMESEYRRQYMR